MQLGALYFQLRHQLCALLSIIFDDADFSRLEIDWLANVCIFAHLSEGALRKKKKMHEETIFLMVLCDKTESCFSGFLKGKLFREDACGYCFSAPMTRKQYF